MYENTRYFKLRDFNAVFNIRQSGTRTRYTYNIYNMYNSYILYKCNHSVTQITQNGTLVQNIHK